MTYGKLNIYRKEKINLLYKNMICGHMLVRKKLRMPWYAFRSPCFYKESLTVMLSKGDVKSSDIKCITKVLQCSFMLEKK